MKAILEFDLDNFEERLEHKRAISATDAYLALNEIQQYLRSIRKYSELEEKQREFFNTIDDKILDIINDHVNMDNLN
jgi:hypothetical protein